MKSVLALFLLMLLLPFEGHAARTSLDSKALGGMEFTVPSDPECQNYLGTSRSGTFKLTEIPAQVLLVEIFSMYCPYCQADAPTVNEIYKILQQDPVLSKKVRLIGIGTGNTPFEVDVFRKKYDIKFPLFPDEDSALQKMVSEPIRTPTFIALKKTDKRLEVHKVHVGESKNAESFLKEILEGLNLK
ncbi:peroxiredoxin family protein [Desulfomonile tiedjei]|nr:TlpA disulfide reductase family protein [Desulfomonile tiedjei]